MTMKRINFLYIVFVITFCSCVDEELVNRYDDLRVTAEFANTRVIHKEAEGVYNVLWEREDKIGLFTESQDNLQYSALNAGRSTDFVPVSSGEKLNVKNGTKVYAYYPYTAEVKEKLVKLPYNDNQAYSDSINYDFLYATGIVEDNVVSLQFKHFYTYLKLTIQTDLLENTERLQIVSMENVACNNQTPDYFDPIHEQLVTENEATDKGFYGNRFYYNIPKAVRSGKKEITCYIAMYPQSENVTLSIKTVSESGNEYSTILTKKAPKGGFQAGYVYSLHIGETHNVEILKREREALIALYNATDGDNWTNNENWCSDKPVGEWYGVETLYGNDRVNWLVLSGNNLRGTLPPELSQLEELKMFRLYYNELWGEIPQEYINLSQLVEFDVSKHELDAPYQKKMSGEVPDFASHCPYLRRLFLSNNQFTGQLPESHEGGIELKLNGNLFTGTIPKSHVYTMDAGMYCKIFDNNLSGKIPDEIVNHPNFHVYWWDMMFQNKGYCFDEIDIPSHTNTVKCYDDSFIDLGAEYAKNKYTLFFTWGDNLRAVPVVLMRAVSKIYEKYKEQGLGVIGMTTYKYDKESVNIQLSCMPNMKHFWGAMKGNAGAWDETWDNYPWSDMTNGFFLFRQGFTPFFHVVDNQGNIIFWGHGIPCACVGETQYPLTNENIFSFIGSLFGNPDEDGSFEEDYVDVDYSRDGEVVILQQASVGKGIDLVFMGDFFLDIDMDSNGKYEQEMINAMEQFFAIEPYKSFRNRFNVYAVKVVSKSSFLGAINGDDAKCFEYALKVPNINKDRLMINVVYNTEGYAGRSYTNMYFDGSFVSYMMEDMNEVLIHEAGGHGFAKLLDEYEEIGYGVITQNAKEYLDQVATLDWGWASNVDYVNTATDVKWAHLLADPRYKNEVGIYEGAYLYRFGAYRPTENSMMRYNIPWFNAPSREAIYKAIMTLSEGESWTYNYEDFVQYDAINRNAATTRGLQKQPTEDQIDKWKKSHRPPVKIKGTWRDAMKKKRQITSPLR